MTTKHKKSTSYQLDKTYSDEADLLKAVVKYFEPQRRDGIMLIKVRDRYARGYSDLFINVRGQLVLAELKDDIGEPSVHQVQFLDDMIACGAIGGVCRTLGEVISLVDEAKRRVPEWPI